MGMTPRYGRLDYMSCVVVTHLLALALALVLLADAGGCAEAVLS